MRIALVTETYPPEINGVARTLSRLVDELEIRGHSVHIVRPRQKHEKRHKAQYALTHVKGLPIPGYSGLQFGLPANRKLYRLWHSETPELIYVATEGPLGWSAIRIANKLDIPVISGFHTNFHSYSKHYNLGWLEKIIFRYLRNLHNKTRCTLTPSPELVTKLTKRGIPLTQLFSRGIDTQIFSPAHRQESLRQQWGAQSDDTVLLYVGRIAAEKNIDVVLDSYLKIKQQDASVKLVMTGDGPLLSKLKKHHPDIIYTGSKIGKELSQTYASADVFLFASESETFGNVVLEAMSSGLAVVAYNYAACRMHIINRQNGIAIEFGNAPQFIQTASELVSSKATIKQLGSQARITAEENAWEKIIDNFEKLVVKYAKRNQQPGATTDNEPVSADGSA